MLDLLLGILAILLGIIVLFWSFKEGKGKEDFKVFQDFDSYGTIQGYLAGITFIAIGIILLIRELS